MFAERVLDQLEPLLDGPNHAARKQLVRGDQLFDGVDGRLSQRLDVAVVRRVDRPPDVGSKPDRKASVQRHDGSFGPVVDELVEGVEALLVDVGLADVLSEDRDYGNVATL